MRNLWIIIGREYATRVKKKSFIILTLIMPFLMAAVVCIPMILGMIKGDEQKTIAIIDNTGKYASAIIEAQKADSTKADGYVFMIADKGIEEYKSEDSDIEALLLIDSDLSVNPNACRIYSSGEVQQDLLLYIDEILNKQVRIEKMKAYNIPNLDEIMNDIKQKIDIKTIKWNSDGDELFSSTTLAMMLGLISALMIYMFVLLYGAMVMQSVFEEKSNRIVEVIVSCVKPFHLMMGKILGILFVGLTQIGIWGIMIAIITTVLSIVFAGSDVDTVQNISQMQQQNMAMMTDVQVTIPEENNTAQEMLSAFANLPLAEIGILFIVYFLGGYILYSSFYAAIGASVNSQEDSSQFMTPMIIIMIFALYGAMGSLENTDGPLAFWASMFPLTSPIVMMVRIPFGVPLWQEILSVILLFITALGFVWMSGRIYRTGILMYGKKPTLKEMAKWIFVKKV